MENKELLRKKALQGLEDLGLHNNPEYKERLELELTVIEDLGFETYFLTVQDLTTFAHNNDILVGPGRGSGVSSLLCYCIGITLVDPIKHKLYFERFMSADRVSPPDLDIDFSDRDTVIKYIENKYGKDRVARVGSLNFLRTKSAIKDIGRVLGEDFKFTEKLTNLVPPPVAGLWDSFAQECEVEPQLLDQKYAHIMGPVEKLWGVVRSYGTHAGGVAIAPGPINRFVPLYKDKDGNPVSQFDWRDLEAAGLLKFDILGLKTLQVIQLCLRYIKESGESINLKALSDKDKKAYEVIQQGRLDGIFQLGGSESMKQLTVNISPKNIEDLSLINALFRPGPLSSGLVDDAVAIRQGRKEVEYVHEAVEPILRETYGVCIFQDELIDTPRGPIPIKNVSKGDTVFNGKGAVQLVKRSQRTGIRKVTKYILDSQQDISVTEDHRVLSFTGWEEIQNVKVLFRRRKVRSLYKYISMSNEECWLIGLLIADGCLNSSSPVISVGQNEERADLVGKVLESLFGGQRVKYFHCRSWYAGIKRIKGVYRNEFNTWLRSNSLWRKSKLSKVLPTSFNSWDEESLCSLLAGMFDGDGHIGNYVTYSTSNPNLRSQLILILDWLKISWFQNEHLTVIRDTELFKKRIGPKLKFKRDDFKSVSRFGDLVINRVFIRDYINDLRKDTSISQFCRQNKIPETVYHSSKEYIKIRSVIKYFPELKTRFTKMLRGENCPQRIIKKQNRGFLPVWDIEVEGSSPSFLKNSIILHNCIFQEQVMNICTEVCGYTLPESYWVMKCLGKKLKEKLREEEPKFVNGAITNGVPRESAKQLFEQLKDYGQYLFNKSHSLAYSVITYWCVHGQTKLFDWKKGVYITIAKAFKEGIDYIACYDEVTHKTIPGRVKKIIRTTGAKNKNLKKGYILRTKSNKKLVCSADHKILTPNGYKRLIELCPGDLIASEKRTSVASRADVRKKISEAKKLYWASLPDQQKMELCSHLKEIAPSSQPKAVLAWRKWWNSLSEKGRQKRVDNLIEAGAKSKNGWKSRFVGVAKDGHKIFSFNELVLDNWLYEHNLKHETQIHLPSGKVADFLCKGLYIEFDGMGRTEEYFARKFSDLPYLVITNRENISDDLQILLETDHIKAGKTIEFEPIKSIEEWKNCVMYDVVMEEAPHNFLANNIVVHNCAYLKGHYPVEFYAALLACESKPEMVTQYVSSAKDHGIEILPPDVNSSEVLHTPEGNAIRFGLGHIKGMPRATAEEIVRIRKQEES